MENNNNNGPQDRDRNIGQSGTGGGQPGLQDQGRYAGPHYTGQNGDPYNGNYTPYNAGQYNGGGYYDPNAPQRGQNGAPGGFYQQQNMGNEQRYVFINGQMYVNSDYNDIKENKLKKAYRRLGNSIGLPLCLFFIGSVILGIVLGRVLAALSIITGEDMTLLLEDPNFNYVVNAVLSILLFTVPFLVTPGMTGYKWSDTVPMRKAPLGKSTAVVMLGLGVCALSNIASAIFGSMFKSITGNDVVSNDYGQGKGIVSFIIMLLCVGVLPALVEEFAFRGVILGTMRKYMGDGASIFLSAMLFGLLHGNLVQIPFAFGVGLILGYSVVYTGSMIPGMVLHCINNTMSVVLSYALVGVSPMIDGIMSLLYLAVLLLIGACGLIMLLKIDRNAFCMSKERTDDSDMKVKYFCSSAWMIVFYVICAIEIFITQAFSGMTT